MTKERAVAAWKVVAGPKMFFINSSALPRRAGASGMKRERVVWRADFFFAVGEVQVSMSQ